MEITQLQGNIKCVEFIKKNSDIDNNQEERLIEANSGKFNWDEEMTFMFAKVIKNKKLKENFDEEYKKTFPLPSIDSLLSLWVAIDSKLKLLDESEKIFNI